MRFTWLFLIACFSVSLIGCGGGGGGSQAATSRGMVQVHLKWPERGASRQVPAGANSVRVTIESHSGSIRIERLLVRPTVSDATTTEVFENLPMTQLHITAVAYPNADGTGTAQAETATITRVSESQPTELNLAMESTIAQVKISPENVPLTGLPVLIAATAYDAENNLVLTDKWEWQNGNGKVLSLKPGGSTAILTAVGPGSSEVSVTETESGVKLSRSFHVAPLP
jgi:hypothetical protein